MLDRSSLRLVRTMGFWLLAGTALASLAGCGTEKKPAAQDAPKFRPSDETPAPATEQSAALPIAAAESPAQAEKGEFARNVSPRESSQPGGKAKAPSGDAQQLLAQFDSLTQQQPKGTTEQEQLQDFLRIQQQRLAL